jgi:hypothetical protein
VIWARTEFMCVKSLFRTALVGAMVICGLGFESLTSASHAGEYYTRKRVNGVWITGHFRRKAVVQAKTQERSEVAPPAVAGNLARRARPATDLSLGTAQSASASTDLSHGTAQSASASTDVPTSERDRLLPLQRGLEQRAKTMAMLRGGAPLLTIKSMVLDFENRVRTIVFVDGSRAEEPFDPTATGTLSANAIP